MTNRKILYGYQIQRGELTVIPQEAETVRRITTLYLAGASYQKISASLNGDGIPFSSETPLWNKHKVKRLLENPRYTGTGGYPPILDSTIFRAVQEKIKEKTEGCVRREKRPALALRECFRCECGGPLCRTAGKNRRTDTLYLKCESCGKRLVLPDSLLLSEVSRQMTEHDAPPEAPYAPSSEAVRLTNAIDRGLERPEHPEDVVALILQGISARYDCCPATTEYEPVCRPAEVDLKRFGQAVSHITITGKTIEIEWENVPITGQFQIRKYAAEYNEVTGTAAGAPLKGAVYEISEARSGKVVDYITTDARGVAASKPLPLGRYKITEVTAPPYWKLSGTVFDETLENPGSMDIFSRNWRK